MLRFQAFFFFFGVAKDHQEKKLFRIKKSTPSPSAWLITYDTGATGVPLKDPALFLEHHSLLVFLRSFWFSLFCLHWRLTFLILSSHGAPQGFSISPLSTDSMWSSPTTSNIFAGLIPTYRPMTGIFTSLAQVSPLSSRWIHSVASLMS